MEPADVERYELEGQRRMQQLMGIQAGAPEDVLPRLRQLPWIRVREVIDHPLTGGGGFGPALLELIALLWDVTIHQRGPGILGFFSAVELNLSPVAEASYDPGRRILRLNFGMLLYANELEATYDWLDSILFRGADSVGVEEIARLEPPAAVMDELGAVRRSGSEGIRVGLKRGLEHPIGHTIVRFVAAHELAHLIDAAESPRLQTSWREAAWSDYEDALQHAEATGEIDRERHARLQRAALPGDVADRWAGELMADGMGFYTVSTADMSASSAPGSDDRGRRYAVLQVAVETFFLSLAVAYGGDSGSETHPPPLLRSAAIRANQRKLWRRTWPEFLAGGWGAGVITAAALERAVRRLR